MAVTPDMIAVALGRGSSFTFDEGEQWSMWIGDAEMLIETRRATLGVTEPIDQAKLDYVIREAVVAHVRRPDSATQVTVSVNDASTSRTYQSGRGRIEVLDEWWTLLGLSAPSGGAFAIDTVGSSGGHAPWCSLHFPGGTTCSCGASLAGWPMYEPGWW